MWDATKPAGSQKIRLSDEEIRANWAALEAALGADLTSVGVGSKMPFYADIAPTGWTIDATVDDKLLFVTKGSAAGGETGGGAHSTGSWTITGVAVDAHTHNTTSTVAVANHTALTVNAHTALSVNNHTALTINTHGHTGPSHVHSLPGLGYQANEVFADRSEIQTAGTITNADAPFQAGAGTSGTRPKIRTAAGGTEATGNQVATMNQNITAHTMNQDIDAHAFGQNITNHVVTNNADTSGAASATTTTHTPGWRPDAECVIICAKN